MSFSNYLNRYYTFILNKDNRAVNYYNTIINSAYKSLDNINFLFNINQLDNSNIYESEQIIFRDVKTKYDASKIMKNYYQSTEFLKIISDNLNYLVLKCDKININLDYENTNDNEYKFHFCYKMDVFKDIFNLTKLNFKVFQDRKTFLMYLLSKDYLDMQFDTFLLINILVYILGTNLMIELQNAISIPDAVDKLILDFNTYIDTNNQINTKLDQFVLKNIYQCYVSEYSFDTNAKFQELKTYFQEYINISKDSLFNEIKYTLISTLFGLSYVLDIINFLYTNNFDIIPGGQRQSLINIENNVYRQLINKYDIVQMTEYMLIPYKYRDIVKFIHLIPTIVEEYVGNLLYTTQMRDEIFNKILFGSPIMGLQFDFPKLSNEINTYINSIPNYFLVKSNYSEIINLVVKLQIHKILRNFFDSEYFSKWQLNYLQEIDLKTEYKPVNVEVISRQNFIKLFLIHVILNDLYVNDFAFGTETYTYIKTEISNMLSTFTYQYNSGILDNLYYFFNDVYLHTSFKMFVDSYIYSSLIYDIVIDRLNYYLLR